MKKSLMVLVLVCFSIVAFAQQLSLGAGASWSPMFYSDKATSGSTWQKDSISESIFGASAFIDATYVQISLGYAANGKNITIKYSDSTGLADTSTTLSTANIGTYVSISALGKYPFELDGGYTLFPLLGFEYDLNLSWKSSTGVEIKSTMNADRKADLNRLWIKA